MFKGARKVDLKTVCVELRHAVDEDVTVVALRTIILESKEYKDDPDFVTDLIQTVINDRLEKEHLEKQKAEEERIRLEREFELQKLKLESVKNTNNSSADAEESKSKHEAVILDV